MKKFLPLLALVVLALTAPAPLFAFDYEETEIAASELVPNIAAGTACNGGAVTAPGGLVIECPTNGGPRCSTKEECHCAAMKNPHGGYDSENICKKKP